ncbi:hypothetical protein RIF29_10140 [Crotalaria pallida]|uniref:Uncharacterized protein n=1 Tax=Crotalaria pallida TaxID=3830 RepID=A0AAN9FSH6_CROPI
MGVQLCLEESEDGGGGTSGSDSGRVPNYDSGNMVSIKHSLIGTRHQSAFSTGIFQKKKQNKKMEPPPV